MRFLAKEGKSKKCKSKKMLLIKFCTENNMTGEKFKSVKCLYSPDSHVK